MNSFQKLYNGLIDVIYERDTSGNHWNFVDGAKYSDVEKLIYYAQKHPLLTSAVDFTSQIFSRAEFWVEKDGVRLENHWLVDLINKPGFTLTRNDFLRQMYFNTIVTGTSVMYPIKSIGFDTPIAIRLLDSLKLSYPKLNVKDYSVGNYDGYEVTLDKEFENSKYKVDDLVFLRDLPINPSNVEFTDNLVDSRFVFTSYSRFEGQLQTLYNTVISLEAKEVILKTNGKELYTNGGGEGSVFGETEREDVKVKINQNYGLTKDRSRAIVSKAKIDYKSLHIPMRDLGLDDSIKTDAKLIFGTLQIPNDLMNLDSKKSSYQNQKESIVGFMQNVMQPKVEDFTETMTTHFLDGGFELKGGYDHMPVMKYILDQKYKGTFEQAKALNELLKAGVEWEDALEMVDIDPTLKRDENRQAEGGTVEDGTQETPQTSTEGDDGEDDE